MAPTPTDGSYRTANIMERGPMHAMSPGPLKGLSEQEQGTSRAAENRAPRGNSSSAPSQTQLQTAASSQGTGGREDNGVAGTGPGNMPSGISVLELKQMTALRMAHAQGHLGGASSFPYGGQQGGQKQGQQGSHSRGSSPSGGGGSEAVATRESTIVQRTASSKCVTAPLGDIQRARRHSFSGEEPRNGVGGVGGAGNGGSQRAGGGDVPHTPGSSSEGSSGGGERRRSPSPLGRAGSSPPSPPPPPHLSGSGSAAGSSSRASPATSSMPHGLTVQELKELTKMRLAKEAFNIPVYSVLQGSSTTQRNPQQNNSNRPNSPGPSGSNGSGNGVNGGGAKAGGGGGGGRGRPVSPGSGTRRRNGSRSPGPGGANSTPSSPDHVGERPHRRTRRGGRRGRNRSPRPDGQYSPTSSARVGGGSTTAESRDSYSSASPSPTPTPRDKRTDAAGGGGGVENLSEPDEQQLRQRSSSQPRGTRTTRTTSSSMNHDQQLESTTGGANGGGGMANGVRRGGGVKEGGVGARDAGLYLATPHLDMYGGGRSHGHGNNTNGHGGGRLGASSLPVEVGSVHRNGHQGSATNTRGRSAVARTHGGVGHGGHDVGHWESRSRGRISPSHRHPSEAAWSHEVERRRREVGGAGGRDIGGDHGYHRGGRGGHEQREHERAMPSERPRSTHLDRGYIAGGFEDQVHYREREERRQLHHVGGSERSLLRGYDPRDDMPPPPRHSRLQRAHSESIPGLSTRGGARMTSDGRYHLHQHHKNAVGGGGGGGGVPGMSPQFRSREPPSSSHHHRSQIQHHNHNQTSQHALHLNGRASSVGAASHGHIGGGGGSHNGRGTGSYDYEYIYNTRHRHHQSPALRGRSGPGGVDGVGGSGMNIDYHSTSLHHDDLDVDHHYDTRSVGSSSGGGVGGGGNSGPGGWNSSSLPPLGSLLSTRQGRMSTGSDGRGESARSYGHGLSLTAVDRHASSGSLSEAFRDDISHTVAESVLVTPKTPGGPAQWRTHQMSSWQGQPPSGALLASPSSGLHERDQYAGQAPPSVPSLHHHAHSASPIFEVGSASRHHGDDRSSSSTDSFPSARRKLSTGSVGGAGAGAGSSVVGNVRGTSHLQNNSLSQGQRHQQHRQLQLPLRGDHHSGRDAISSSLPNFGGLASGEIYESMLSNDDMVSSVPTADADSIHVAYLPSMTPSGRGGGQAIGHVSPTMPSQSPLLSSARFPGSAPSAFHRESFPLLAGDNVGATAGGYAVSDRADSRFAVGVRGDSGGVDVGGVGVGVGGTSPMIGSLPTSQSEDNRHSPLGSPIMAGLTFSLDLAGYGSGGGSGGGGSSHHPYHRVGSSLSEGAGSTHGSDFLGFETAGVGAVTEAGAGAGGASAENRHSGGGGLAGLLAGLGGGEGRGVGDGLGSSPNSVHSGSVRESSSLPRQLEISPSFLGEIGPNSRVDTSSLFSFGSSLDRGQTGGVGGERAVDEIAGRVLTSTRLSSTPPGLSLGSVGSSPSTVMGKQQQQNPQGSGTIGGSRNHNSATSSPSESGRLFAPPTGSRSPMLGAIGPGTEVTDGAGRNSSVGAGDGARVGVDGGEFGDMY